MNILFLAASPLDYGRLRVNREGKEIREQLRNAKNSAQFNLLIEHATKVNDLQTLFLTHQPDIVHFSGHASKDGELVFEDEDGTGKPVSSSAIARLFTAFGKRIRCVIFNACYSELLRESIGQHVECVIGTTGLTDDNASICFSTAFYQALGYGESIERAYEWGSAAIELMGFDNTFVRYRHSDSLAHSTNYLSEPNSQIFLAGDLTKQDKHEVFEQSEFAQRDTSTSTKWLVGELNGDLVLMNRNNLVTDDVSHSESQSKAVPYYVSALGLIGDNELADRMRITRKIGACYRKNGQWDDAKRWLSEGLVKTNPARLDLPELILEYMRIQLEFAYCYVDQSEFNVAQPHLDEVIKFEEDLQILSQFPTLRSELGSAYNLRSIIAYVQHEFEDFRKFQTRASENYALVGEFDRAVDVELNRQYAELQLGNYTVTMSFYERQSPEELCNAVPDRLLRAYLNWILANLEAQNAAAALDIASKAESYSGDIVDHLRLAIAFADAFKSSAASLSDHNAPDFESYRKRMIEKIGKGASLVEKLDASTIEAKLFKYQEKRLRAEWYTITGDYDLAEDEIHDALRMYPEIPETSDAIYVKCELDFVHALLYRANGRKSVALEKLLELSRVLEQNYFFGKKVNIDIEIAELQIEEGQLSTARKTLLRAEVFAQKYDRTHNIAKIETLMAQLKQ